MTKQNYCLIDKNITESNIFFSSLNENTFGEYYETNSTAFNPEETNYERLCFVFKTKEPFKNKFINDEPIFTQKDLLLYKSLKKCSTNFKYVINLIRRLNVKNVDFLACELLQYSEWVKYFSILNELTSVTVGASHNKTGNITFGGDWTLESTGEEIKNIYFTNSISNYSDLLVLENTTNELVTDISLGGSFVFNGQTYTSCRASSNGFIYFESGPISTTANPLEVRAWKAICPFGGALKTTEDGIVVSTDNILKTCTITFNCYSTQQSTSNILVFSVKLYLNNHATKQNQVDFIYTSSTYRSNFFTGRYYIGYTNAVIMRYVPDADNPSDFSSGNACVNSFRKFPANGTTISNVLNIVPTSILKNATDGSSTEHSLGGLFVITGLTYSTCNLTSNGTVSFGEYMSGSIHDPFNYSSYRILTPFSSSLKTNSDGVTIETSDSICTITFNCYSHKNYTENLLVFKVLLYLNGHEHERRIDYIYESSSSRTEYFRGDYYLGYSNTVRSICCQDTNYPNLLIGGASKILSTEKFPMNGTRINDIMNIDVDNNINGVYLANFDDAEQEILLGGTFVFGGTEYTTATINSNGFIYFDEAELDSFDPLNSTSAKVLCPFCTDLVLTSSGVTVNSDQTEKTFSVLYDSYGYYTPSNILSFKIIIYYDDHPERPNQVDFVYISSTGENSGYIGFVDGTNRKTITSSSLVSFDSDSSKSTCQFPSNGTIYTINNTDHTIKWKINQTFNPNYEIIYDNTINLYSLNLNSVITGTDINAIGEVTFKLDSPTGTTMEYDDTIDLGNRSIYSIFTPSNSENYVAFPIHCDLNFMGNLDIFEASSFAKLRTDYKVKTHTRNDGVIETIVSWFSGSMPVILKFYRKTIGVG